MYSCILWYLNFKVFSFMIMYFFGYFFFIRISFEMMIVVEIYESMQIFVYNEDDIIFMIIVIILRIVIRDIFFMVKGNYIIVIIISFDFDFGCI